jgi:cation diffusion facilitator CzcD-associated flavoprotein CzcO
MRDGVAKQLPPDVPIDPHFAPRYAPWDQRLCVVPDGDFFAALRSGQASVATAIIEKFTEKGVRLTGGEEIEADIIVTATGLSMVAFGEMTLTVDGRAVESGQLHVYKGMMFDGLPNLAWCVGYTNASWTLRADLTTRYLCRLLNYMSRHDIQVATPAMDPAEQDSDDPLMDLRSGYVQRAAAIMPRQGARGKWRVRNNYLLDLPRMRLSRIDDGAMRFTRVKTGV